METKKQGMIQALEKSLGVVTSACKSLDISRQTHYRWMQEDDDYAQAVKELDGVALDFAESKLHEQINNGNPTCIIFYLKTKGRQRGYIEKQDHDIVIEGKVQHPDIIHLVAEPLPYEEAQSDS